MILRHPTSATRRWFRIIEEIDLAHEAAETRSGRKMGPLVIDRGGEPRLQRLDETQPVAAGVAISCPSPS
jgi:hypothetical protein